MQHEPIFPFCSSILQQKTVPSNSSMGNKPLVACNRSDREGQTWWHLPALAVPRCGKCKPKSPHYPPSPVLRTDSQYVRATLVLRPGFPACIYVTVFNTIFTPKIFSGSQCLLCYGRLTRDDQEPKSRPAAALSVRKTVRIVPQLLGSLSIHPWGV